MYTFVIECVESVLIGWLLCSWKKNGGEFRGEGLKRKLKLKSRVNLDMEIIIFIDMAS